MTATEAATILIIDDMPGNLGMAVSFLEERGYRVSVAQDGEEGLARAELLQPDLILLDVMMPDIDGFEVCRRLKALPATTDIPVIFMTALADVGHKVEGFQAGSVDYVTKPLQIDEVAARVATHIKINALQRRLTDQNNELERLVAARTEQMALLNIALDNAFDATYLFGKDLRFRYVNEAATRALGYSREELLTMTVLDIDPSLTPERLQQLNTAPRVCGRLAGPFETVHRHKNGTIFPVEIGGTDFKHGDETLLLSIVRDVTERKRMESVLRKSELEFRSLTENSPDIIVRYDCNGQRTYVNPAYEKLSGLDSKRVVKRKPEQKEWRGDPSAEEYLSILLLTMATGEQADFLLTWHKPDGTALIYSVRIVAEFDDQGKTIGALSTGRDITRQKITERQLQESRDQLRELAARQDVIREEERKHIAREIHDELGQMLTAQRLELATANFQFGSGDPRLANHCQRMIELTDHTIQTVRGLAAAIRPPALDMGAITAMEWLVSEFRQRTGTDCRLMIGEADIALDEKQSINLFRIVQESLTNITRYADAHQVGIMLETDAEECHLSIRDDGRGFDPNATGTGSFGLIGIQERALALGGMARILSTPGQGTTIDVRIPRHTKAAPSGDHQK